MGHQTTNMVPLHTLLAVGIAVAAADMTCPSTSAAIACGMKVTTNASASCADVLGEMKARIAGQYGAWHDPHNNGTYSVESYGGTFSTSRLTGDGKYTDKQIFTLTDQSGSCLIEACSRSQVFSIGDAGTNYCDVKMLFCGSKDGCKPVKNDFTVGQETTSKFAQASVDMGACLKVYNRMLSDLVERIQNESRDSIFKMDLDVKYLRDEKSFEKKLRPWLERKIDLYMGGPQSDLVEYILRRVNSASSAHALVSDLEKYVDDNAEALVERMWRMHIFELMRGGHPMGGIAE